MIIELIGGPYDGRVLKHSASNLYMLMEASHPDHPVYKRSCCADCAAKLDIVSFNFIGYDSILRKARGQKTRPKELKRVYRNRLN